MMRPTSRVWGRQTKQANPSQAMTDTDLLKSRVSAWAELTAAYELGESVTITIGGVGATYTVVVADEIDRRAFLRLDDSNRTESAAPTYVSASALDECVELYAESPTGPVVRGVVDSVHVGDADGCC